jgi:hypothetical protein
MGWVGRSGVTPALAGAPDRGSMSARGDVSLFSLRSRSQVAQKSPKGDAISEHKITFLLYFIVMESTLSGSDSLGDDAGNLMPGFQELSDGPTMHRDG